jgi:S-adenosylmethionine synthetase
VSVLVDTFGTGIAPDEKIEWAVRRSLGLKPAQIIKELDLLRPDLRGNLCLWPFSAAPRSLTVFTWEAHRQGGRLAERAVNLPAHDPVG